MNERIAQALNRVAGFELINCSEGMTSQLRLTGRISTENTQRWMVVVKHLLAASEDDAVPWTADISRMYFVRADGADHKLLYSWRIIFATGQTTEKDIKQVLLHSEQVILEMLPVQLPDPEADFVDVPLIASSTRLGLGPNGKGARGTV